MIQAFAVWISGYSLGNNAEELIDYYNHYSTKTKDNGTDKDNNEEYPEGTAAWYDLIYHAFLTMHSYMLFTFIMFMGYFFSWWFAVFHPVSEVCDVEEYDSSKYSGLD